MRLLQVGLCPERRPDSAMSTADTAASSTYTPSTTGTGASDASKARIAGSNAIAQRVPGARPRGGHPCWMPRPSWTAT